MSHFPSSAFALVLIKRNMTERFEIKDQKALAAAAWTCAQIAPRQQVGAGMPTAPVPS